MSWWNPYDEIADQVDTHWAGVAEETQGKIADLEKKKAAGEPYDEVTYAKLVEYLNFSENAGRNFRSNLGFFGKKPGRGNGTGNGAETEQETSVWPIVAGAALLLLVGS